MGLDPPPVYMVVVLQIETWGPIHKKIQYILS